MLFLTSFLGSALVLGITLPNASDWIVVNYFLFIPRLIALANYLGRVPFNRISKSFFALGAYDCGSLSLCTFVRNLAYFYDFIESAILNICRQT